MGGPTVAEDSGLLRTGDARKRVRYDDEQARNMNRIRGGVHPRLQLGDDGTGRILQGWIRESALGGAISLPLPPPLPSSSLFLPLFPSLPFPLPSCPLPSYPLLFPAFPSP